jgi:hypothetical protein
VGYELLVIGSSWGCFVLGVGSWIFRVTLVYMTHGQSFLVIIWYLKSMFRYLRCMVCHFEGWSFINNGFFYRFLS